MKLQQLRYVWEVAQHGFKVSAAADSLMTSQPGISKQIRLLEEELGFDVFVRNGKNFVSLTKGGEEVVRISGEILAKSRDIRQVADEFLDQKTGVLTIATTHTQARYALPSVMEQFMRIYPNIRLNLQQGTPLEIAALASRGEVDVAIATESTDSMENLVTLPCYRWNRSILVPQGHPLISVTPLTLEAIAEFPIVTYTFGFTGRSQLDRAFENRGLQPHLALTAVDADVIKTYVRLGLGIGIVAHMAYEPREDADLVSLDAGHLFEPSTTRVAIRRDMFIRGYLYDFIQLLAPHLTPDIIDQAMTVRDRQALNDWLQNTDIPFR
jgi:LysR family transcriptional regulator, cys regulon transcriptional activator